MSGVILYGTLHLTHWTRVYKAKTSFVHTWKLFKIKWGFPKATFLLKISVCDHISHDRIQSALRNQAVLDSLSYGCRRSGKERVCSWNLILTLNESRLRFKMLSLFTYLYNDLKCSHPLFPLFSPLYTGLWRGITILKQSEVAVLRMNCQPFL